MADTSKEDRPATGDRRLEGDSFRSEKTLSDYDGCAIVEYPVVAPRMTESEFSRLLDDLDALELVFKLDVLHFDTLSQQKLGQAILAHGKLYYPLPE